MIKIAINPRHRNKMPHLNGSEVRYWWREFNGSFVNVTLPKSKLVDAIRDGRAYTAQHHGYRKAEEFICGQHIGLDFDTGDERSSFDALLNDSFTKDNAYVLHTTASHTTKHPRSRAIFVLEAPVYDVNKYALLTEAFANHYSDNGSDVACKDPVRLFFGAEGCETKVLGNILTFQEAARIVVPFKEVKRQQTRAAISRRVQPMNGDQEQILTRLARMLTDAPDGEKWHTLGRVSLLAGGYVSAGYLNRSQAYNHLLHTITSRPIADEGVAIRRINWGLDAGFSAPVYLKRDEDPIFAALLYA